jgi:hypothetical protein
MKVDLGGRWVNPHPGFLGWLEPFCTTNELLEMWNVKDGLREECHVELFEHRGINTGDQVFRVLARAIKDKFGENGEDNA